jgi:hypothetical protein
MNEKSLEAERSVGSVALSLPPASGAVDTAVVDKVEKYLCSLKEEDFPLDLNFSAKSAGFAALQAEKSSAEKLPREVATLLAGLSPKSSACISSPKNDMSFHTVKSDDDDFSSEDEVCVCVCVCVYVCVCMCVCV